jgi:hypothetical protein
MRNVYGIDVGEFVQHREPSRRHGERGRGVVLSMPSGSSKRPST